MIVLTEKHAVVTGANRGIGKAIVKLFAENGASVWACARKPDAGFSDFLAQLTRETGSVVTPIYFDLNDAQQVKDGARKILESCFVDVLVNNAGVIHTALFQMTTVSKMKEIFETNYFSPMSFTQYMAKKMASSSRAPGKLPGGSIINISSSAGIDGNAGRVAYAATKAALNISTRVLAEELGAVGIRVNAIAPGLTETDMMRGSTQAEVLSATLTRTCLKRVGEPSEIASVALFLASDLSSYVTGQVLRVDGGM